MKDKNRILYEIGDSLRVDISTKRYPDAVLMIDKIDYENIRAKYKGHIFADKGGSTLYAKINIDKKNHKIHRLICPNWKTIDHIDGNGLNNQKSSNLRESTRSQNGGNLTCRKSNNKSGYTGVCETKTGKWNAYITINGKQINLGTFKDKDQAILKRLKAEKKHFREFMPYRNQELLLTMIYDDKIKKIRAMAKIVLNK